MIIWVILFVLIIAISFVLAYRSMVDYQEIPQKKEENYGLYLVRASHELTNNLLDSIRTNLLSHVGVISLERLFKGKKSALCIFGPKNILEDLTEKLQLLELEDYTTGITDENIDIWEVGIKDRSRMQENPDSIFKDCPKLYEKDQFFWQVVLGDKGVQIRAAIFSENIGQRRIFTGWFEDSLSRGFVKIPRPYSTDQMLNFFRSRSLGRDTKILSLCSIEIMHLLKI